MFIYAKKHAKPISGGLAQSSPSNSVIPVYQRQCSHDPSTLSVFYFVVLVIERMLDKTNERTSLLINTRRVHKQHGEGPIFDVLFK